MTGFFGGRVLLMCEERHATELLNLFAACGISYDGFSVCGETLCVWIGARHEKRVRGLCEAVGICLSVEERIGLPFLVKRYGRRSGILVGSLLAVLILVLSSRIVWSVRVTGNEALSEEQILTMLSSCGLARGTYLPPLDTDAIENRMLTEYGEICWVSVNLKGTMAYVEVLETMKGTHTGQKSANLVAARDGQIERIEAYDGVVCVSVGDVVREGDLLVSGVYDKGLLGYRVTRARGAIYARTVRHFSVEVPLECDQKVYTGREWSENYVKFFSSRIKVFANTGKMGAECDIIYRDNGIVLPDGSALPVGVLRVIYREYRNERICLDGDEAMDEAFLQLSAQLERFVSDTGAELLSKTIAWELDEDAFRISCSVVCIEDIARTLEFDVVEKK